MNSPDLKQIFGTAIRAWRSERGFSQEELAKRTGLGRRYVSDVEKGTQNPSLENIGKLASALEVTVAGLFARAGGGEQAMEILLVEDDEHDVNLTLRAFRKARFTNRIHVARDGAEAIEFLFATGRYADRRDAPPPALILLDLNLPKLSGVEILRWIKADQRTMHIPVVVLTESRQYRDAMTCRDLGVQRYIVKPVDFHAFSEVAAQLHFAWEMTKAQEEQPA